MRFLLPLFLTLLLFFSSCQTESESSGNVLQEYFIESKLSFFDPQELIYAQGKYQGYTYETWLRKPQHLKMIHETLKKIGYDQLISKQDLRNNPNLLWGYVNRPLNHLIDSLIITYPLDTIETQYYREFWQRRRSEQNEEIVFEMLNEISLSLLKGQSVPFDDNLVNDTLYHLVSIKKLRAKPTEEQALRDFEYLKSIGLHGSAYHLLYESSAYQGLAWDKAKLKSQLKTDTLDFCPHYWIEDNTK